MIKYWLIVVLISTVFVGLISWKYATRPAELWLLVILFITISVVLRASSYKGNSDTSH